MSWRVAESIKTLQKQINALFPKRSKISDGTIGDAAHSSRTSDHNPNSKGVVCAVDITHDPINGVDCHKLADLLVENNDPRLKYIIWNRRIISKEKGWKWRTYSGKNPHNHHLHISVGPEAKKYDDARPWDLEGLKSKPAAKPSATAAAVEIVKVVPPDISETITEVIEPVKETAATVQETVRETVDEGNKQIETAKTEITNTFEPKNIPAFIPRFGKQWLLGLIPGGGLITTILAKVAAMPDWLVFMLGFFTGMTTVLFFQLLMKHREKVTDFIIGCYRVTADPARHNLIPTNAAEYIGSRQNTLIQALSERDSRYGID